VQEPPIPEKVQLRGYNPTYKGHKRQIEKAMELIMTAERPVIYAGGGVIASGAATELVEFATRSGMPVATTLMGIGTIPCDHPLKRNVFIRIFSRIFYIELIEQEFELGLDLLRRPLPAENRPVHVQVFPLPEAPG
jgi:thiamine pyrophosphate-dependent acetolactate synthase large subunit-like protein